MKKEIINKEIINSDILEKLYKHNSVGENRDKLAEMKAELTILDNYFFKYIK